MAEFPDSFHGSAISIVESGSTSEDESKIQADAPRIRKSLAVTYAVYSNALSCELNGKEGGQFETVMK